jgi:2,4-dienoyl-CoA reductase (NADPH2)
MWFQRLCTRGVSLAPFRTFLGTSGEGAILKHVYTAATETIPCDAVVYAYTRKSDDTLYHELKARHVDVRRAGDCVAPRSALFAVHDGFEVGTAL